MDSEKIRIDHNRKLKSELRKQCEEKIAQGVDRRVLYEEFSPQFEDPRKLAVLLATIPDPGKKEAYREFNQMLLWLVLIRIWSVVVDWSPQIVKEHSMSGVSGAAIMSLILVAGLSYHIWIVRAIAKWQYWGYFLLFFVPVIIGIERMLPKVPASHSVFVSLSFIYQLFFTLLCWALPIVLIQKVFTYCGFFGRGIDKIMDLHHLDYEKNKERFP